MCHRTGRAVPWTPRAIARLHESASGCLCQVRTTARLKECFKTPILTTLSQLSQLSKHSKTLILPHNTSPNSILYGSQRKGSHFRSYSIKGKQNRELESCFPDSEEDFMAKRIQGLGWGFMYSAFIPINVTVIREFYPNFSAPSQPHVFLRGKRIPFFEDDIGRHLRIPYELPPAGEDDIFKNIVTTYNEGNLNMDGVFEVIGKERTTWANDPAIIAIPKKIDNAILNAKATAWHKLIMANIDPKTHGTSFLMEHTLLIYVLMTEGIVKLPRIMRDIIFKHPTGNSRNLLPYPMFIARLADHYQVPEYHGDMFYKVREQDMYCLYEDWKGEQPKVCRGRMIPPPRAPLVPPPEQHPPSP
ncbi:hypothetical protein PIB30_094831 [Stylosanthes scabra]|uniref:Putative plant transposon protein domain-containing protein n=1 Tax=Stylosanthes scabra TaxID=79078 RepID=A0ABU6VYR7_9FABA|nr:hypothetical protein [Stylosanthes scabra]